MTENPDATVSGAAPVSSAPSPGTDIPAAGASAAERGDASDARQPVVRVRGARRARLMAAPGTTAEPAPADDPARGAGARPAASGPNDERMIREVPPHY
ncbi:hypothetical protein AB1K56_00675 [Microbacterium sp. BWR-S6Y]|uniref:hypothetical protein n=1 Tax=Microbacterium sp. BWR-S6Y TaxID=3232073 RepID=UPI0035284192